MCKRILMCLLVTIAACPTGGSASAQLIEFNWTGGGDGTTWDDPANWDRDAVPDGDNHIAVFDSVTATIELDSEITLVGVCLINNDNLEILGGSFDFVGFGFSDDPDVKVDNSMVTISTSTVINTGPGDDVLRSTSVPASSLVSRMSRSTTRSPPTTTTS